MSTSYIPSSVPPQPAHRTSSTGAPTVRSAYLPGLDGIRALAVLGVCLFHFLVPGTQGGFLGVDVFFIVSGYLITSQLWTRWGDSGIRLWPFWEGRIRRLFPAVIVLCLSVAVAMLIWGRDQMRGFLGDLSAAATYTSNWWYIHKGSTYAVEWGLQRPPVLQHLWSLAVEEQFYLLWPLVIAGGILACRRHKNTRWVLAGLSLSLAVLSGLRMTMGSAAANLPRMSDTGMLSADRWYYGTDSHAMGLLLGATLALVRGGRGFGTMASGRRLKPLPPALPAATLWGCIGLLGVIASFVVVHYNDVWLYRWGFHLVALSSLLLVAVATRPGPLSTVLSLAPLRYLGTRSYSIYLWHWPIVCFTRPTMDLGLGDGATGYWASLAIRIVATLVLSEMSYRFVETPVRRHGWRAAMAWLKTRHLRGALAGLLVLTLGMSGAWAAVNPDKTIEQELHQDINDDDFSSDVSLDPTPTVAPTSHGPVPTTPAQPTATATPTPTPTGPARPTSTKEMTVAYYGDSFAIGAVPGLRKVFKSVDMKAAVGRQSMANFKDMMADVTKKYDVVILHAGNNGTVSESSFRQVLAAYAKAPRVIVVLPITPRSWTRDAREMMIKVCGTPDAPKIPNVRVADWATLAAAHPEYRVRDQVHPTGKGIAAYTKLIQEAAVRA